MTTYLQHQAASLDRTTCHGDFLCHVRDGQIVYCALHAAAPALLADHASILDVVRRALAGDRDLRATLETVQDIAARANARRPRPKRTRRTEAQP